MRRILHGLDRLPATLSPDDPRLPAVEVGSRPLRLNSFPIPPAAWESAQEDHASRMAALRAWAVNDCGDYNVALRRAVMVYLDAIEAHIASNRDLLSDRLARFHGLYQPEDWCWSALRPLPRAWWWQDGGWVRADLVFWDGNEIISVQPRELTAGVLPPAFHRFWEGEVLPVSPFRRPFPAMPDIQTVISST